MSIDIHDMDLPRIQQIITEAAETVDRSNLDKILETHTAQFEYVTRYYPMLQADAIKIKREKEEVYAGMYVKIRQEKEVRSEKFTETLLNSLVILTPEYKDVSTRLGEADMKLKIIDRGFAVFKARETAIMQLISLYKSEYWALFGAEKS